MAVVCERVICFELFCFLCEQFRECDFCISIVNATRFSQITGIGM